MYVDSTPRGRGPDTYRATYLCFTCVTQPIMICILVNGNGQLFLLGGRWIPQAIEGASSDMHVAWVDQSRSPRRGTAVAASPTPSVYADVLDRMWLSRSKEPDEPSSPQRSSPQRSSPEQTARAQGVAFDERMQSALQRNLGFAALRVTIQTGLRAEAGKAFNALRQSAVEGSLMRKRHARAAKHDQLMALLRGMAGLHAEALCMRRGLSRARQHDRLTCLMNGLVRWQADHAAARREELDARKRMAQQYATLLHLHARLLYMRWRLQHGAPREVIRRASAAVAIALERLAEAAALRRWLCELERADLALAATDDALAAASRRRLSRGLLAWRAARAERFRLARAASMLSRRRRRALMRRRFLVWRRAARWRVLWAAHVARAMRKVLPPDAPGQLALPPQPAAAALSPPPASHTGRRCALLTRHPLLTPHPLLASPPMPG